MAQHWTLHLRVLNHEYKTFCEDHHNQFMRGHKYIAEELHILVRPLISVHPSLSAAVFYLSDLPLTVINT